MCSTCNYKNFYEITYRKNPVLQQDIGEGSLVIRCDPDGQRYCIANKNEDKSDFRIYRCPTCGRKLF